MTGWAVAGLIVLVLWLCLQIRLGVQASFLEESPRVFVRLGVLRIQVFPMPEPSKKRKKRPKKQKKETPKMTGAEIWRLMLELIPLVGEAAGTLKRKIRIDHLMIHLTWAAPEPDQAALGYGQANGGMGVIWPILHHHFQVKTHDLWVDLNYEQQSPELEASVAVSMTLGQLAAFGIVYGVKLLKIWSRSRRSSVKKQEVQKV